MPAKVAAKWDDREGFLDERDETGGRDEAKDKGEGIKDKNPAVNEGQSSEANAQDESPLHPSSLIPHSSEPDTQRSDAIAPNIPRPTPPFWGTKILQPADIPWDELFWYLDLQALIAGQWQFRKPRDQSREEYDEFLQKTVYPILEQWKHRIVDENLLHPQAVYGYFPCQADGNSVHLYEPLTPPQSGSKLHSSPLSPAATFTFPAKDPSAATVSPTTTYPKT